MSMDDQEAVAYATPPNTKRRRLNGFATPASLTKPFKSPFRAGQTPQQHTTPLTGTARKPQSPIPAPERSDKNDATISEAVKKSPIANRPLRRPLQPFRSNVSSPLSRHKQDSHSSEPVDQETSNAIAAAQRAQTSLITQIAQTRQDIDALKQAVSLASSTKDADLEELAEKWTAAARLAAEEVFSTCKDKVNKMGGVGAWREREQQQKEWQQQWDEPLPDAEAGDNGSDDDEDEDDGAGEEGMEDMGKEERRAIREMRKQLKAEKRDAWDREYEPDHAAEDEEQHNDGLMQGNDDDTFTMDMMLKILNIDLDIIGYSKEHQLWVG